MKKGLIIILLFLCAGSAQATIGMQELSDSLMNYTGFSRIWSPNVRVRKMRVDGNHIVIHTNATLSGVRWTEEKANEIEQKISLWVLGHNQGKVQLFTQKTNIRDLITPCALHPTTYNIQHTTYNIHHKDLTERHIAIWPSHGLYFNHKRQQWIWQRATLWTTVEDLYSQEYIRLLRKMLENSGANIYMPRAGLEHTQPGPSGMPRWTEGARYWMIEQQMDSTLWNLYDGDEYKDDMKCRTMWVNHLSQSIPIDLCLALHTDGLDSENDSTIIGTLCIYTTHDDEGNKSLANGQDRRTVNRELADWIQTQVVNDLRTIAPHWTRRQLLEANYCESRVPVVPSIILELLSHKNMADMQYGLDPQFRFTAARAIYKGILRYLNGQSAIVQPLPVQQIAIQPNGHITWTPTTDTLEHTATPSYYLLYTQENGGEWKVQQVEDTQYTIPLKPGVQYNCYVVAGNEGGLSFPSPTISAYISNKRKAPIALIIDAFDDTYGPEWFADSTYAGIVPGTYACEDRYTCAYIGQQWDYTRQSKWINDDNCGWGASYRDHAGEITIGNTRDYSVLHGNVLQKMNISYVSTTPALATIDSTYLFLDLICGRQRQPLPPILKDSLTHYLTQGGKLLISSDHISQIDKQWLQTNTLTRYYAKNATRAGKVHGANGERFKLLLHPNTEQLFSPAPEGLMPTSEQAQVLANYLDMRCPAAIGTKNANHSATLVWGFPLEATTHFEKIYQYSINWLISSQ